MKYKRDSLIQIYHIIQHMEEGNYNLALSMIRKLHEEEMKKERKDDVEKYCVSEHG